jgi:tripartite-type tricarboxylate transporter receptor subunit TctC
MLLSRLAVLMGSVGLLVLGAGVVSGQAFPNKPLRILTSAVGGSSDYASRQIAHGLTDSLGQQVIVDNRVGIISLEQALKAQPDGYTLYVDSVSFWLAPLLQKMSYETLRDFSPISFVSASVYILVVQPSVPAKSVREFIDLAKAKPGTLNYGSGGTGSGSHLATELFKSMAGVNLVHVPYKGTGPAVIALLGSQIELIFASGPAVAAHIKSGKLRALAVTSAHPTALAPGVPPVAASGLPGYEVVAAIALFAPAKTPTAIINQLSQETARVLKRPDVKQRFFDSGAETVGSSPEELAAMIKSDVTKWGKLIKDAGIKVD